METFCLVLIILGLVFLFIAAVVSEYTVTFFLVAVGTVMILIATGIDKQTNKGKPAPSLNVLVNGEEYEVVSSCEKYIIIKTATDGLDGLKFIGPLDCGTITSGRYIKTAEGSLEKIE